MLKKINIKTILLVISLLLGLLFIKVNGLLVFSRYLILYLLVMLGSASLSCLFNKKISQTLPLYFIISFVWLYIFGIFNILKIGLLLYIIINVLADIYTVFKLSKNKKYLDENIFTSAFFVYTFLFALLSISTKMAAFAIWDEFSFWSIATKNMYYLDSLYITSKTTLMNNGYPPCPTILQYFFCKILGNYSQGIELFTYLVFGFSLFMPFFKKDNSKNILFSLSILFSILFIPAIFVEGYFYKTIYADSILGILVGYLIFEVLTSDNDLFLYIIIILTLFTITLTKSIGIFVSLLVLFILVINELFKKSKKINIKKYIIFFLAIAISILSWKFYIKFQNVVINYGYSNPIKSNSIIEMISNIYHMFIGTDHPINTTFSTFFKDFFDKAYYTSLPFPMSGSMILSLFVISYYLVYKFLIKDKEKYKRYFILVFILAILYIAMIQVAYFLVFSEREAIIHASMQRYIGSIFISMLMVLIGIIYNTETKSKIYLFIPILLLPFTPISVITDSTITSGMSNYDNNVNLEGVKEFSEFVTSKTTENDKIFPVHQTQNKDSRLLQFRYFMTPRFVPMVDSFDDDYNYNYIKFNSKNAFEKELYSNYDYVVVLNTNDYFNDNYGDLFDEKIEEWSLYKILKFNNKVTLKKVK